MTALRRSMDIHVPARQGADPDEVVIVRVRMRRRHVQELHALRVVQRRSIQRIAEDALVAYFKEQSRSVAERARAFLAEEPEHRVTVRENVIFGHARQDVLAAEKDLRSALRSRNARDVEAAIGSALTRLKHAREALTGVDG